MWGLSIFHNLVSVWRNYSNLLRDIWRINFWVCEFLGFVLNKSSMRANRIRSDHKVDSSLKGGNLLLLFCALPWVGNRTPPPAFTRKRTLVTNPLTDLQRQTLFSVDVQRHLLQLHICVCFCLRVFQSWQPRSLGSVWRGSSCCFHSSSILLARCSVILSFHPITCLKKGRLTRFFFPFCIKPVFLKV